jgi:hypothetical protein
MKVLQRPAESAQYSLAIVVNLDACRDRFSDTKGPGVLDRPVKPDDDSGASIQLGFHAALDGGPRHQGFVPAFDVGEVG